MMILIIVIVIYNYSLWVPSIDTSKLNKKVFIILINYFIFFSIWIKILFKNIFNTVCEILLILW